ncbi:MAG TPA: serine/threonine-protein kinase, partial [Phormidium sp.]
MNDSTFSQGQLFGERYRIVQKIGEGGMQRVFKAVDTLLDKHVALKVPKNLSAQKRFQRSAIVSAKINHPNVAKTLDYIESDSDPCLIEELIEGKDLQLAVLKPLGQLDPYLAARIFHYLAKGISASHHAGVIHRDLKPSNVMVAGGINLDVIKITDFGIAKMAEEELAQATQEGQSSMSNSQTALGALPYMSPEMLDPMQTV